VTGRRAFSGASARTRHRSSIRLQLGVRAPRLQ
jgi:hypothetical protein